MPGSPSWSDIDHSEPGKIKLRSDVRRCGACVWVWNIRGAESRLSALTEASVSLRVRTASSRSDEGARTVLRGAELRAPVRTRLRQCSADSVGVPIRDV